LTTTAKQASSGPEKGKAYAEVNLTSKMKKLSCLGETGDRQNNILRKQENREQKTGDVRRDSKAILLKKGKAKIRGKRMEIGGGSPPKKGLWRGEEARHALRRGAKESRNFSQKATDSDLQTYERKKESKCCRLALFLLSTRQKTQ